MSTNTTVRVWTEEMAAITKPDCIEWITGDEAQLEKLRNMALATGELLELNQEKLPRLLFAPLRSQRCRPGGEPYLHLLQKAGRMPAPPTTGLTLRRCTKNSISCTTAP